jgi:hypothetical protein
LGITLNFQKLSNVFFVGLGVGSTFFGTGVGSTFGWAIALGFSWLNLLASLLMTFHFLQCPSNFGS